MRSRRFAGALLALTLVAAACGGDDDSADTTDAPSAPETTMADDMASETTMADDMATETTMADDMASETTMADDMTDVPEDWPEKIVFGFVPSQEQEQLQDDIQPFIDVLEAGLGIEVEGVVTTDYTGLVTAMGSGPGRPRRVRPVRLRARQGQLRQHRGPDPVDPLRFGDVPRPVVHQRPEHLHRAAGRRQPRSRTRTARSSRSTALDAVALQVGVFFGDDGKALGEINDERRRRSARLVVHRRPLQAWPARRWPSRPRRRRRATCSRRSS